MNNKSRWLKRSVVIHLKRVKLCLLYPPPYQVQSKNKLKIALAVLAAFTYGTTQAAVGENIDNSYFQDHSSDKEHTKIAFTDGGEYTFDAIDIPDLKPLSRQDQYMITSSNGSTLTITGNTYVRSHTYRNPGLGEGNNWAQAVYGIYAESGGQINLEGNIDIEMGIEPDVICEYGINAIYAKGEKTIITLGSEGSTTKIWVFADKPDSISAKEGGNIVFASTNNQIVGSIDMISQNGLGTTNSRVQGTFSGESSFWFGDDQSTMNATIEVPFFGTYTGKEQIEELYARLNSLKDVPLVGSFAQEIWSKLNLRGTQITDQLDLTFENGAQWTYFGISDVTEYSGATLTPTPKRISAITLKDRGIINLFDANIQDTWKQLGLTDLWPDLEDVNHDYVRIGDLKGSGGIFRLDLDGIDKTKSDMVYIEGSSDPGQHYIEPYNLDRLETITPENTLVFALVDKDASNVTFVDKINLEGETLYDYELQIDHSEVVAEDLNRDELTSKDVSSESYIGGTKWFIERFVVSQSASALSMNSAGFAAYDAAIEMDRRDRRLLQTFKDEKTGLWVRARHGERGVKNEYGYQLNGFALGTDYAFSDTNALGIAFSFEKGDTDFMSVVGDGNMKRYELAVYNTHDFGAPYLDFVGRLGIVKSDYTAYNQSRTLSTSGDFDQKYATLSAEAGYTLEDTNGVFIEPQVQVQLTYLKDYDYASDRNMHVSADSDYVVLSRVGLRGGRHFDSESLLGEVYGRADVYHQFTDGQDAIFRDTEQAMFQTWGTNKTFASIGLGSYLKAKSGWGVQFDVEKNLGGKSIDSWMITGQARYEF